LSILELLDKKPNNAKDFREKRNSIDLLIGLFSEIIKNSTRDGFLEAAAIIFKAK